MQGLNRPGSRESRMLKVISVSNAANQAAQSEYKSGTARCNANRSALVAVAVRANLT